MIPDDNINYLTYEQVTSDLTKPGANTRNGCPSNHGLSMKIYNMF